MKTTNLELPDGTLVTIHGGDAESNARFIHDNYIRPLLNKTSQPAVVANTNEEPLVMPSMYDEPVQVNQHL